MECTVNRFIKTVQSTIGTFEIGGQIKYYTLEPAKCIPAGRYEVIAYESPRFGRKVPCLKGVPGHELIELHVGNKATDTHGCSLLGYGPVGKDFISNSQNAVNDFYVLFFAALGRKEKVFVTYKDL